MAKFHDVIGFQSESVESAPGVWTEGIVERKLYGDITRNTRKLTEGESVNNDISVNNNIEVVADAYASEHFFAIRYVKWAGAYWIVSDVEVRAPRLLLRLGGVYNGPKPTPAP